MTRGREVLQRILDTAEIDAGACAAALGLNKRIFSDMLAGQREIPPSLLPLAAAVLGVKESVLSSPPRDARNSDFVPAIWYKLRSPSLSEVDREYVLSIRQLAYYQHQLEAATDSQSVGWNSLFEEIRRNTDPQASPTDQGRKAARLFRRSTSLDKGARGIGEVFRGNLRSMGLLVIESVATHSVFEGCSFYVGPADAPRPCLFANSYRTTWFRRNEILMHELAHAIFDLVSDAATLDLTTRPAASADDVQERRANAFAQEMLVPAEVLRHLGQQLGMRWDSGNPLDFAPLAAETHVEQNLLAKALLDAGLISDAQASALSECNMNARLKDLSAHALSTKEFLQRAPVDQIFGTKCRTTTAAPRKLLLPPRYVGAVLEALEAQVISRRKAARMLMIDEYEFEYRFGSEEPAIA